MKIDATTAKQGLSKHRSLSTYYYCDYKRRSVTLKIVFVRVTSSSGNAVAT